MRIVRLVPTAILGAFLTVLGAAPASAADEDVLAGYQRFHRGDPEGARRDFESMVAASPGRLPARFGVLQVLKTQADDNRTLEPQFERLIDSFIADAERRHNRSATDDEALFYLANGYLLRAVYRVDHDKGTWGAARDGARSKGLAETYIKRRPEHGDAYFTLGMYNYYVEIAPSFIKLLRPLLFLPAGNRTEGIKQLERAYTQGSLFAFQAGMQLVEIFGSLENRPADGTRIGEQLLARYPDNPRIQFALADLYLGPAVEDPAKAATQYRQLVATESRRAEQRPALYQAQLGLASSLVEQWRIDEAIQILSTTIDTKPSTPPWVMPGFSLRRANYRALIDDAGAEDDVKRVLAEASWKEHHKGAIDLQTWMTNRRRSGEAARFAAVVPANRLAAERKWDEAAAAYESLRRRWPDDPGIRYRIVALQFARGDAAGAAAAATVLANDKKAPSGIRAQSWLIVARTHDLAGRRNEATKIYNRIVNDYEQEEAAWTARVGLVTPFQRR